MNNLITFLPILAMPALFFDWRWKVRSCRAVELVIPPPAFCRARQMSLLLVIAAGVFGSLLGAIFAIDSWLLGRAVILILADHKFARILHITPAKVEQAENSFSNTAIFPFLSAAFCRLSALISIPAGFSKMNFGKFVLYTFSVRRYG